MIQTDVQAKGSPIPFSNETFLNLSNQSTKLYNDANQNPFGNSQSIEFGGNESDPNFKTVRLRDRLNEADTERRKEEEAAELRERAAEIAREERLKKIAYMNEMPDSTPAGTGKILLCYACDAKHLDIEKCGSQYVVFCLHSTLAVNFNFWLHLVVVDEFMFKDEFICQFNLVCGRSRGV